MRKLILLLAVSISCTAISGTARAQGAATVELKTATGHPMQYYVSRPANWTRDRKWPIVIAVEAAEKEFKLNAERFAKAGKDLPFIIVTPINVTNGNAGQRDPKVYPYSNDIWDRIAKEGICAFDEDGLLQVVKDVRAAYNGEDRIYLTGFEAGAHLVWATVFHRPELLAAAAPVAGNYRGRCVEGQPFSGHAARVSLPIRGFAASRDEGFGPGGRVYGQWQDARKLTMDKGYGSIGETIVADKGHVPLPDEVLAYFMSLRKAQ